jgi:hypothetical protein
MKKSMRISSLKLASLAIATGAMFLFTACQQEDPVVSEDQNLTISNETQTRAAGPSANGQGTLTLGDGTTRHFSFHAREKNNGSVDGSGVLTYTAGALKVHFDIDCLNIVGNTAIMTGTITKWKDNPAGVGNDFWFKAEDNGEGSNSDPDRLTLFLSGQELEACDFDYGIAFNDVEGGNIQVKE